MSTRCTICKRPITCTSIGWMHDGGFEHLAGHNAMPPEPPRPTPNPAPAEDV